MARATVTFPKAITRHYIDALKRAIHVDGVLLFGSYAWGKPTKHSDVDLVVISRDFKRKRFGDRLQWLSHMRDEVTYQIAMDVVGYTPQEFTDIETRSAIMAKAKREGRWIYRQ